jgi:MFS family permease
MAAPTKADDIQSPDRIPSRVRYRVLAVACSLAVITYIHRLGFARALPELKLGDRYSSWLTAAFMVAYGIFEVPCGLLGDRIGARHLIAILVVGWSLVTGCVGLVGYLPDLWMLPIIYLIAIRFLFGMFQAGAFPLLSRMMADWMSVQERATAQGSIWMASRVGGMLAPFLFWWLLTLIGNWQTPLWILAGLGVVWAAAFWPWFRNRPDEMRGVNEAEQELIRCGRTSSGGGHGGVPWGKMLRSRSAWFLCLMYGCGGFASNFYVTLLPTYLETQRGFYDEQKTWLSGLPFAFGLLACFGGGFLSDWLIRRTGNRKWARRLNGLVGLALGALGWLMLSQAEDVWAVGFVLCFIFVCNDLNMGPAWAACADIGEMYAGTLGGAMNMVGSFFGAAGNYLAGALFEQGRAELVFLIYACSFGLASLCWLGVDVNRPVDR